MRRHRFTRRSKLERLELRQLLVSDILFAESMTYGAGSEPTSLEVADFDRDGQLDLAVANPGSDSVSFLRGFPDGRFERLWPDVVVSGRPLAIAAGDLDQDGIVDLVTANEEGNQVAVIYGLGEGEFERPRWIDLSGLHESIALADMNEDGRLDILVTTNGNIVPSGATNLEPGVHVIFGRTLRRFDVPEHIYDSSWPVKVIATDLNGDRHLDVAIANDGFIGSNNVEVVYGAGDGTFGDAAILKQGDNPQSLASADLNADGRMDVIIVREETIGVLMNRGNGAFATETTYFVNESPSPNPSLVIWGIGTQAVAVSDLDADGDLDLAVANYSATSIYVLANQGDGTLRPGGRFPASAGMTAIAAADFNGDQLPELSVVNGITGEVAVLQNTSTDLPTAVLLDGRGDRYAQDFDMSLWFYDGPGARLPIGWSAIASGNDLQYVTNAFPPSAPLGIVSAGLGGDPDRTLATGVPSAAGEPTGFVWTGRIDQADTEAIRVNFDIEAWAGDPGKASDPGEASFHVVLKVDTGQGFEIIHDFGQITTGEVLQPPPSAAGVELWKTDGTSVSFVADIVPGPGDSFGLYAESLTEYQGELYFSADNGDGSSVFMNGNAPANRFEFDSGPIAASIPAGATIRLRFITPEAGANAGYVYGLDNFAFEILGANQNDIPGDANRDGIFNSKDFIAVFLAGEYEDGIDGNSTWEEGDWNGDGDFDSSDFVVAFLAGHYVTEARPLRLDDIASLMDADDGDQFKRRSVLEPSAVDELFFGGSFTGGI